MRLTKLLFPFLALAAPPAFAEPDPGSNAMQAGAMPPQLTARLNAASAVLAFAQSGMASTSNTILPGCVGDGIIDDTVCVQAAITATQNGVLNLGNGLYRISAPLVSAGRIAIVGSGGGLGQNTGSCAKGFRIDKGNFDLLTLNGSGSRVDSICVDSLFSTTTTSGSAIKVDGPIDGVMITNNQINGTFIGIWTSAASGIVTGSNTMILNNIIKPVPFSGAAGILVGATSTNGHTVDPIISGNVINCGANADGMVFKDAGGALVSGNSIFGCGTGTKIIPGQGQRFDFGYFTGTLLGDTSLTNDLLIDTMHSSAAVSGTNFVNSWASNSVNGPSVVIRSTQPGIIRGLHFVGHRTYMNTNQIGFDVSAGEKFTLDSSTVCSLGNNTATGIRVRGTAQSSAIRNNSIGACDHLITGTLAKGVEITQASGVVGMVTGNDFNDTNTSVTFAPGVGAAASTFILASNIGIDNLNATIATGSSISLPLFPRILLTGTTSIQTMSGGWGARELTLVPTGGAVSFVSGGNICNFLTASLNSVVIAYFDAGAGCWRLK